MFLTCVFALAVAQPPARPAALNERLTPHWLDGDARFWYRADRTGGREFVLVDSDTGNRRPAFDHAKLAAGLSKAAGTEYAADRLPFTSIEFVRDGKAIRFVVGKAAWTCDLTGYECKRAGDADPPPDQAPPDESEDAPDPLQAAQPRPRRTEPAEARSPDGNWTAAVKDHNVVVRAADGKETALTSDGTEAKRYGLLSWSPDSTALAAFRITPGDDKPVHLVESSPKGGGRAVLSSRPYPLPGDAFTRYELRLFAPAAGKAVPCAADPINFGFPRLRWAKTGHAVTYEQVDRGHQRFRLVEVDAATGTHRHLIDERSKTFVWTTHFEAGHPAQVTWLSKSNEFIHASEKSGWRHLYLVDAKTGEEKNPITRGEWVVRGIDRVDEDARQVWFRASGVVPGQDPYFVHHYRVNLDGTGLVALTAGDGTHTAQLSPTRKYLIDSWSRVDKPPVHELRRADGTRVAEVERADVSGLPDWAAPEVFTAKGRDGSTDIWGVVHRPKGFDPKKTYPVIESIYAGPHGAFVPKAFSAGRRFAALTDLGFVVVQIDGMGTAHRSKAFHDVCWQNLKDAGFPDRILWHKAVAAKYPWYDVSRVGITGGSAGGQSASAALLFHGDFYSAAVSGCGCHDNRMDKASWNEQWMGHPVGPQYAASSNIDHAHKLRGKLLLVVGELDTNVPPESTYRLCDALIKAGKDFDFVLVPGGGHGMGGSYGQRRLEDFFVRHLLKQEPPDRNAPPAKPAAKAESPPPSKAEVAPKPRPVVEPLDLVALVAKPANEAVAVARRFEADRGSLTRAYPLRPSATRTSRLRKFYADWLAALTALDSTTVSTAAREELAALRAKVGGELRDLEADAAADAAVAAYTPFAEVVVALDEARRRTDPVDPQAAAGRIAELPRLIEKGRAAVAVGKPSKAEAARAADVTARVRGTLKGWFGFYDGYDPLVTWWAAQPVKQADAALESYAKFLTDGTTKQPERLTATTSSASSDAPDLKALLADKPSELAAVIERFQPGRGQRSVRTDRDPAPWREALAKLDFDKLSADGKVDYVLLRTRLERDKRRQELAGGDRPKPPKDDTKHRRPADRPGRLAGGTQSRVHPVHARGAGRARPAGDGLVRGRTEKGRPGDGPRRRLEEGGRGGEAQGGAAGRAAPAGAGAGRRGGGLPPHARPRHRAAAGRRDLADGHDDRRAAVAQPVLHRRRSHQRRLPDQRHGPRRQAAEPAGQQPALLQGDRPPRADPRPPPAAVQQRAGRHPPPAVRHPVLDRGLGLLLGDGAVRPRLPGHARRPGRLPGLADPPLRPGHLLARLPPGRPDPAAVRGPADRAGRVRAGQRPGRGAAVVRRRLPAPVPSRLPGRGHAVPGAAGRAGRFGEADAPAVPRRGAEAGHPAGGAGAGGADRPAAHPRRRRRLAVRHAHRPGRPAAGGQSPVGWCRVCEAHRRAIGIARWASQTRHYPTGDVPPTGHAAGRQFCSHPPAPVVWRSPERPTGPPRVSGWTDAGRCLKLSPSDPPQTP